MARSILVCVSIVLMALHQCQSSSSTTESTTVETTTESTTESTTVTETTTDSTTTATTTAASSSTTSTAASTTTAATAASTDSTVSTTAGSTTTTTASTGSSAAPTGSTGSSTTATGSTDPTSSTTAKTIECYNGGCNGSGCLTNVSKDTSIGRCTSGGTCKLVEDKGGDEPVYTMSCFSETCDYTSRNEEVTENCCSTKLCNDDIELLSASTTLLVSAWSVALPCLYMLAV